MWLMFLHFPCVIKHAAVTKFTAVTTAMCHESVTEPGAWRVTLSQPSHTIWHHRPIHLSPRGNIPQHFLTAALHSYSTLPGHEHVIITQPLQEIFVCVSSGNSPHWNKIVIIAQPLQTRCWSSSLCVWCYLRVPRLWQLRPWPLLSL